MGSVSNRGIQKHALSEEMQIKFTNALGGGKELIEAKFAVLSRSHRIIES